jgi:O-antigen ligase
MWRLPNRQWILALPPLTIALLQAVIGLLQDSSSAATAATNTAVSGTFVNRDHFSAMLEMCLPFAAGAVFEFAPAGIRGLAACAGAATAALLFVGIALSLSRGGLLIALVSLVLLIWLHAITGMRGIARAVTVAGSLFAVASIGVVVMSGRMLDRLITSTAGDLPLGDRIRFWQESWRVVGAYPIVGCGFGGFVSAVMPFRATSVTKTLDYAHNDYLQFLAEGGIVPFVLACIVGAIVLLAAWRAVFRPSDPRRRGLAIACSVALYAGLLHSAVDLITYVPATAMLLCWISGMTEGLRFDERAPARPGIQRFRQTTSVPV